MNAQIKKAMTGQASFFSDAGFDPGVCEDVGLGRRDAVPNDLEAGKLPLVLADVLIKIPHSGFG